MEISVDQLKELGSMIARSAMFNLANENQGAMVAWTCIKEGITPLDFAKTYNIIDGKQSMRADAMAARFISEGGEIRDHHRTDKVASATFVWNGQTYKLQFTFEDAENHGLVKTKAGKVKDNYVKHPANMLWARLISDTVGLLAPHIKQGVYTPEEISDMDPGFGISDPAPSIGDVEADPASIETISEAEPHDDPQVKVDVTAQDSSDALAPPVQKEDRPTGPHSDIPGGGLPGLNSEFAVCPIEGPAGSSLKGKRWDALSLKVLKAAFKSKNKKITDNHRLEIEAAIKKLENSNGSK